MSSIIAEFSHSLTMKRRLENLIQGASRLARVIRYSFGIQPYFFLVVTLLRTTIRLLHFIASVLPFKILIILSKEYAIPSLLRPYFTDNSSLAYTLCLLIGMAIIIAKLLEIGIDNITRMKARAMLGVEYARKHKRRGRLIHFIRKSTDAASACVILVLSFALLLAIHYQTALVVFALSVGCFVIALISRGKLEQYVESSPNKYMENCLMGITLLSFFSLVHTSINAATPPPFLYLLLCLILIRHYTQSVDQVISIALFFKDKDVVIDRVFSRL
ncbi:MAG: hypothetical protein GY726_16430 [Proteobacteria bacterium]|nr:hypothetical protein [Pseudomonadota bacterium]